MATKKRALKKAKLRHAEYYDFQETQDRLYADSVNGKVFKNLITIITMPENIRMAYGGNYTAEVVKESRKSHARNRWKNDQEY